MPIHAEADVDHYALLSPGLDCSVVDRNVRDVRVIDVAGPLVRESPVLTFRDRIRELLDQGTRDFAINLAEVPSIDSYGLGGLTAAYNLVHQAGGRIKFFAARERLVRTLHRLRLDTVLELFEDEASALSSFH